MASRLSRSSAGVRASSVLLLLGLLASACGMPHEAGLEMADGWTEAPDRAWRAGADTAAAFRDMETLEAMGVRGAQPTYRGASTVGLPDAEMRRAVKQSLLPLFRNEPELVDSLFERFVAPKVHAPKAGEQTRAALKRYKGQAYSTLRRHFTEPWALTRLGPDGLAVPYPEALREKGVEGRVGLQVRLDSSGTPVAARVVTPLHPELDAIALRAVSHMRWQPAYHLRRGRAIGVPSWARFSIRFEPPR